MTESVDSLTLALPNGQDALIQAVSAANPHTIVVLETGGPVSMPWVARTSGVLAAWYPGIGGGEAIADILFGMVNPSGKLPITFASKDADLPMPRIAGMTADNRAQRDMSDDKHDGFDMTYPEGLAVGYRWFEVKHLRPLFAFGHGLSYSTFRYADLKVDAAARTVQFSVRNTSTVAGSEVTQLYVTLPEGSGEPFQRLAAWRRIRLAPGESKLVTLQLDPALISIFDADLDKWKFLPGEYRFAVGGASDEIALKGTAQLR
jgi:beta-glucosidase